MGGGLGLGDGLGAGLGLGLGLGLGVGLGLGLGVGLGLGLGLGLGSGWGWDGVGLGWRGSGWAMGSGWGSGWASGWGWRARECRRARASGAGLEHAATTPPGRPPPPTRAEGRDLACSSASRRTPTDPLTPHDLPIDTRTTHPERRPVLGAGGPPSTGREVGPHRYEWSIAVRRGRRPPDGTGALQAPSLAPSRGTLDRWTPSGNRPRRILQFGTGRFLRGFADAFIHEANERSAGGQRIRAITAVESTGSGMADRLAAQGCAYRLLVRGVEAGVTFDTSVTVTSIERTIDARAQWDPVLQAALSPHLRTVISNVTEAGYALDGRGDDPATGSFPAKLLAVLIARARAGLPGLVILPCELVERNGDRLRELVIEQAARLGTERRVIERIREMTTWGVTLVDRIVTTPVPGSPGAHGDLLAVAAEPFASWVVEVPPDTPLVAHPAIRRTADVGPFALRKIRILNGAHTALVARCRGTGISLVRQAMADPDIAAWLQELLTEEIVPALGDRIEDGAAFAHSALDRFRNPFLDHRLADIALHHETKLQVRLMPTFRDRPGPIWQAASAPGAAATGRGRACLRAWPQTTARQAR